MAMFFITLKETQAPTPPATWQVIERLPMIPLMQAPRAIEA